MDRVNYVDSEVMKAGSAAIEASVRSGVLNSQTCTNQSELTNAIISRQIPAWAALSDAFHNLHCALGHISPQRLVELFKALVKKHVCDVCVRSKISRSSHSSHLIHDDKI